MLTGLDEFSGCGGLSQGAESVRDADGNPAVRMILGANHKQICIDSYSANHPDADTYVGDARSIDMARFPRADVFLAAPICPPFSNARGARRDFDHDSQGVLWESAEDASVTEAKRGRLLMHEVPRYLEAMALRGEKVLCGIVENVVQARRWDAWNHWLSRIRNLGYEVRVIALNSMHARPVRTRWAPQSRDRLFVAYWLRSFGRTPDWDKWLRPRAYCPACDETVDAMQVFKDPGNDMGVYGKQGQYFYRCPHRTCRHQVIDPQVLPIGAVLDWDDLGTRIGDRDRPLKPATLARIEAGIRKHAVPVIAEVGGHLYERRPGVRTRAVTGPVTTQSTTASKALAVPPLIVPAGGTWNDQARPATSPVRTRTARETDGLAVAPFLLPLRSGRDRSNPVDGPAATVVANGSRQYLTVPDESLIPALVMRNNSGGAEMSTPVDEACRTLTAKGHQSLVTWSWPDLLIPYYGTGRARPASGPAGTFTAKERYALAAIEDLPIALDDVFFRMLNPAEIAAAMAFAPDYIVLGNREERVRQYGNAVTPPAGEIIFSALFEVVTGQQIPREYALAA